MSVIHRTACRGRPARDQAVSAREGGQRETRRVSGRAGGSALDGPGQAAGVDVLAGLLAGAAAGVLDVVEDESLEVVASFLVLDAAVAPVVRLSVA